MIAADVPSAYTPTLRVPFSQSKLDPFPYVFICWKLVQTNTICICFIAGKNNTSFPRLSLPLLGVRRRRHISKYAPLRAIYLLHTCDVTNCVTTNPIVFWSRAKLLVLTQIIEKLFSSEAIIFIFSQQVSKEVYTEIKKKWYKKPGTCL